MEAPTADTLFARPDVEMETRDDGTRILRSRTRLATPERSLGAMLRQGAEDVPDRVMLAERDAAGGWRKVTWAEAAQAAASIGQALLDRKLGPERPLMILSGNSVDHALMTLGALWAGVPVAPVSAAYSLMSRDFAKLGHVYGQVKPGLLFADRGTVFAPALEALGDRRVELVVSDAAPAGRRATLLAKLVGTPPRKQVAEAAAEVGPETIAKILFTSGSTDTPKGVINTHGMLTANQQAIAQCWPFLEETPPVLVDWLPWSHTFGGNHNFNMVLRHGGTLYVDEGKPAPGRVEETVANLREVSPTVYFNVPAGYGALLPFLERDAELRGRFFARLQVLFYAAAALPDDLWQRLDRLARETLGHPVVLTSAWGSTETSPLATSAHFALSHAGNIGVPPPGTSIKLVPNGAKQELRVKGPSVMPGYWRRPELTAKAFDADGFYRIGDAGKLADPEDPNAGILFDGRVAEDFKLTTGTWVSVGTLRVSVLEAMSPLVQDAVVAGHDRDYLSLLLWPNVAACKAAFRLDDEATADDVVNFPELQHQIVERLRLHNAEHTGRSERIGRVMLMTEPPSIDAGEITDKGYVNQRATLERRAELVQALYREPPGDGVMLVEV